MKRFLVLLAVLLVLVACQPAVKPAEPAPIEPAPVEAVPEPVIEAAPEPVATVVATASPEPVVEAAPVPEGNTIEVSIEKMAFSQETVTIKKGDTVVWTQNDATPHTVTVTQGPASDRFDSNVLRQGQTFSHTFDIPGTYYYKCSLHPKMRGKIVVE